MNVCPLCGLSPSVISSGGSHEVFCANGHRELSCKSSISREVAIDYWNEDAEGRSFIGPKGEEVTA